MLQLSEKAGLDVTQSHPLHFGQLYWGDWEMGAAVSCKKDGWSCGPQFQELLLMSNWQRHTTGSLSSWLHSQYRCVL